MKVVAKHHLIQYNAELPSLLKGYQSMSLGNKVSFWLKAGCLLIILLTFLRGRPPSSAQVPIPVTPVISSEDAVQDEKINNLHTFETNQENWNHETGQGIGVIRDDISSLRGEERGIFACLGLLHALSMIFQIRSKPTIHRTTKGE